MPVEGDVPNVVKVALDCEGFGAEGITVHPRPDERHIRRRDVYDLAAVASVQNLISRVIPHPNLLIWS